MIDNLPTTGININVNMPPEIRESLDVPAASMHSGSGQSFNRDEVQQRLNERFCSNVQELFKNGVASFRPYYDEHLAFVEKRVKVLAFCTDQEELIGIFTGGIDKYGCGILRTDDGRDVSFDHFIKKEGCASLARNWEELIVLDAPGRRDIQSAVSDSAD